MTRSAVLRFVFSWALVVVVPFFILVLSFSYVTSRTCPFFLFLSFCSQFFFVFHAHYFFYLLLLFSLSFLTFFLFLFLCLLDFLFLPSITYFPRFLVFFCSLSHVSLYSFLYSKISAPMPASSSCCAPSLFSSAFLYLPSSCSLSGLWSMAGWPWLVATAHWPQSRILTSGRGNPGLFTCVGEKGPVS